MPILVLLPLRPKNMRRIRLPSCLRLGLRSVELLPDDGDRLALVVPPPSESALRLPILEILLLLLLLLGLLLLLPLLLVRRLLLLVLLRRRRRRRRWRYLLGPLGP